MESNIWNEMKKKKILSKQFICYIFLSDAVCWFFENLFTLTYSCRTSTWQQKFKHTSKLLIRRILPAQILSTSLHYVVVHISHSHQVRQKHIFLALYNKVRLSCHSHSELKLFPSTICEISVQSLLDV